MIELLFTELSQGHRNKKSSKSSG